MRWSVIGAAAARCDGTVLSLAFVLLLLGYGGLAGLAPLQGWLLEAQAAPAALSGVLGGAAPGVALLVILRLRGVLDANPQAAPPGGPIMALGLAALLLSGAGLWRLRTERRWLALSSSGQYGVVAFAFGLGGATATLAGLVHLTAHSLAKAAAFQAGPARALRWAAVAAVAGIPPFGLFGSLVLVLQQSVLHGLWLAVLLGAGVAASAWALIARPAPDTTPGAGWRPALGAGACLAGALLLGLAMPAAVADWFLAMAAVAQ
jgi:hydrogenase-4 component F